MSAVVRLTLVSHATTDAVAAGRFPTDEPLNALGRRQVDPSIDLGAGEFTALSGPEQRCLQTAELLGVQAEVEPRLADLDCGRWRGDVLGGVLPADLAVWLTDPARAPHGGESVVDLVARVRGWMDSLTRTNVAGPAAPAINVAGPAAPAINVAGPAAPADHSRIVAVTHPAVIRAAILLALDAPPKSFWRIDIAPASRTVLHFRGHAWTLRSSQ